MNNYDTRKKQAATKSMAATLIYSFQDFRITYLDTYVNLSIYDKQLY